MPCRHELDSAAGLRTLSLSLTEKRDGSIHVWVDDGLCEAPDAIASHCMEMGPFDSREWFVESLYEGLLEWLAGCLAWRLQPPSRSLPKPSSTPTPLPGSSL